MKFSVLMSIYYKENPEYFDRAMISLWDDQTIKPNEMVLVQDGKLTEELYSTINKWQGKLGDVLKVVALDKSMGAGCAKNIGIKDCNYDYIAIADSDDVCSFERFEKQISFFKKNPEIDVLGGQIEEFENSVGDMELRRIVPTGHEEIVSFSKKRYAFNHPTIMYRKSAFLNVGGYQSDYLYEDYALSVRILCDGGRCANLADTIVYMRAGDNMFKRRGGVKYAISEAKAQYQFYQLDFLSIVELMQNLAIRLPIRLMPNRLRSFIYKGLLRKRNE